MPNKMPRYQVIQTAFRDLECLLNELEQRYPEYNLLQVVSENCYDGAIANIILELDPIWLDFYNAE